MLCAPNPRLLVPFTTRAPRNTLSREFLRWNSFPGHNSSTLFRVYPLLRGGKEICTSLNLRREKNAKREWKEYRPRRNSCAYGLTMKFPCGLSESMDDLHRSGGEHKGTVWSSVSGCRHAARP